MFTSTTTELSGSRRTTLVTLRSAALDDTDAIARLSVQEYGGSLARYDVNLTHDILDNEDDEDQMILVACVHGQLVGYARALYHTPHPEWRGRHNVAPEGWYLTGVLIAPEMRRMGLGSLLTSARLDHIFSLTDEARYFTHRENINSIALHKRFGFHEFGRGLLFAGPPMPRPHILFHECHRDDYTPQLAA